MKINKKKERLQVPRYVAIIVTRLNMVFQPNRGSSFYKRPADDKILEGQKDWNSPVGTLRLSDHWGYENQYGDLVYITNIEIPKRVWVLCINTNIKSKPWKVLQIFQKEKGSNIIRKIDFIKIQDEINSLLYCQE